MIQVNMLMRMDNLLVQKCTNKCLPSNKNTVMKWDKNMVMRWCMINSNSIFSNSNNQRKIQSKIKSRRLSLSVLKMMHYLVILNSQPMTHHCTMILLIHLNTQWIWELLSGRDHKKLFQKTKSQECIEMQCHQEISKWVFLVIAGSWVLSWFKALTQSFWITLLYMMVFNTDLLCSNSLKMVNCNTSLLIQEFHTIHKVRHLYMVIVLILLNSGYHWWKRLMLSYMVLTKCSTVDKWQRH